MARDGSGNFTRVAGPYINGQIASADPINQEYDDVADALSDSINVAGTKAMGANLSMGGNKLTDLAAGSGAGDSLRYEQVVGVYLTAAAAAAAYEAKDATLTAFAGLTTADDRMLDFTGPDTMAVVNYATVLANLTGNTPTAAGLSVLNFVDPNADQLLFWDDSAGDFVGISSMSSGITISGTSLLQDELWEIALSDETSTVSAGVGKAFWTFPYNVTVISVGGNVNTAGTGLTIDINEGGTSILSTKITLDSGEETSLTAATPPVISDTTIAAGAKMSADIDAATGTSKGAKAWMIVRRTS